MPSGLRIKIPKNKYRGPSLRRKSPKLHIRIPKNKYRGPSLRKLRGGESDLYIKDSGGSMLCNIAIRVMNSLHSKDKQEMFFEEAFRYGANDARNGIVDMQMIRAAEGRNNDWYLYNERCKAFTKNPIYKKKLFEIGVSYKEGFRSVSSAEFPPASYVDYFDLHRDKEAY